MGELSFPASWKAPEPRLEVTDDMPNEDELGAALREAALELGQCTHVIFDSDGHPDIRCVGVSGHEGPHLADATVWRDLRR